MELKNIKINFLGDSITFGAKLPDKANRFSNIIAEETGAFCRNYGLSGTRIARQVITDAPLRKDLDMLGRSTTMDPDVDLIVLFGGTNDYKHGNADIGNIDDFTPFTFFGALNSMISGFKIFYPDAKIALITPCHRFDEDIPRQKLSGKSYVLSEYVDAVKQIGKKYGFPVLDMFSHDEFNPCNEEFMKNNMPDGLHPNTAGHKALAKILLDFLKGI